MTGSEHFAIPGTFSNHCQRTSRLGASLRALPRARHSLHCRSSRICLCFQREMVASRWQSVCTTDGMLRITLPTAKNRGVYVLEGRLIGLWARELIRVVRAANNDDAGIFDLQDVLYVDSAGEEALRLLSGLGAKFIATSAYGKHLCKRLKLHRVTALCITTTREGFEASSRPRNVIGRAGAPSSHSSVAQQLGKTRDARNEE